jgi:putative membrane protein
MPSVEPLVVVATAATAGESRAGADGEQQESGIRSFWHHLYAPVVSQSDDDVTRRTRLAAERTWLAWWRSGIAAATAAVGVGGVVPQLVNGGRTAYTVLGAGYAALAAAMFVGAAVRRRGVERALDSGGFAAVSDNAVLALTLAATILALGTLAVIVTQP